MSSANTFNCKLIIFQIYFFYNYRHQRLSHNVRQNCKMAWLFQFVFWSIAISTALNIGEDWYTNINFKCVQYPTYVSHRTKWKAVLLHLFCFISLSFIDRSYIALVHLSVWQCASPFKVDAFKSRFLRASRSMRLKVSFIYCGLYYIYIIVKSK